MYITLCYYVEEEKTNKRCQLRTPLIVLVWQMAGGVTHLGLKRYNNAAGSLDKFSLGVLWAYVGLCQGISLGINRRHMVHPCPNNDIENVKTAW